MLAGTQVSLKGFRFLFKAERLLMHSLKLFERLYLQDFATEHKIVADILKVFKVVDDALT